MEKLTITEMTEYLLCNGWEQSWSDDNWVRSNAKNKEAYTGLSTKQAYNIATNASGRIYTIRE